MAAPTLARPTLILLIFSPEGVITDLKENGIEENGSSEQYKKLLDLGLVEQVAAKLDIIYSDGLVKVIIYSGRRARIASQFTHANML